MSKALIRRRFWLDLGGVHEAGASIGSSCAEAKQDPNPVAKLRTSFEIPGDQQREKSVCGREPAFLLIAGIVLFGFHPKPKRSSHARLLKPSRWPTLDGGR
jgi:hypothetical protein